MKNVFLFILISSLFSCKDDYVDGNTLLPNVTVNFTINLNLPEGIDLRTGGNYKIFPNKGIRGVIVFNNGLENYTAFDLACPHIELQECSTMTFEQSQLSMKCPCDDKEFSKIDGAPLDSSIRYAARNYSVVQNGDYLIVRN